MLPFGRRSFPFLYANLQPVEGVPDDFPVRFVQGNEAAWLLVGNASRMAAQVDLSLAAAATGVDVVHGIKHSQRLTTN